MKNLHEKVILVCGGATGIGAQTVVRLCEEGASVIVGDFNIEAANRLVADLPSACAIQFDQADEDSIGQLLAQSLEVHGKLNGVFANAADLSIIHEDADVLSNDFAVWQRTLNVNLIGTAMVIRDALPHLLEAGGGAIVCTSSGASTVGEGERPAYAVSKAGINALCRHVATRWGKQGVRCNALAPGFVLTENLTQVMPADFLTRMLKGSRSPRHGKADDIAAAVAFLMSDDGEWVNGQTWHINGGVFYAN